MGGLGGTQVEWEADSAVVVDGTRFVLDDNHPDEGDLLLYKPPAMLRAYEPIIDEFQGGAVVELGIFRGGSTAYFAARCAPRALVAIEWSPERVENLDRFIEERQLGGSVHLHYGVDQADREAVRRAVKAAVPDGRLDLVIDDASHRYGPTVASFEVLFPLLRPGGLYLIEDWRGEDWFIALLTRVLDIGDPSAVAVVEEHVAAAYDSGDERGHSLTHFCVQTVLDPTAPHHPAISRWYESLHGSDRSASRARIGQEIEAALEDARSGRPRATGATLGTLVAQLCLGLKATNPAIDELTVNTWWFAARRGPAEVDPDTFSIAELAPDPLGLLAPYDRGS